MVDDGRLSMIECRWWAYGCLLKNSFNFSVCLKFFTRKLWGGRNEVWQGAWIDLPKEQFYIVIGIRAIGNMDERIIILWKATLTQTSRDYYCPDLWFSKFKMHQSHLEGLLKLRLLCPRFSGSVGLGRDL